MYNSFYRSDPPGEDDVFPKCIQILAELKNEANGVNYAVPHLAQALAQADCPTRIFTIGDYERSLTLNCPVTAFPASYFPIRSFYRSRPLAAALMAAAKRPLILHANALWLAPTIYAAAACRTGQAKLVVSPHGMLSRWALQRSKWKKQLVNLLGGHRWVFRECAMFHATSEQEYREIRSCGLRQPVAVVPLGMDMPEGLEELLAQPRRRKLLFLGRIHPVKGVAELLNVWTEIHPEYPEWELELVGPQNDFSQILQERIKKERLPRIVFSGAVSGRDKFLKYAESAIFVLPSHTENFGIAAAEALSCGTPVITTTQTPWEKIEQHQCGWYIPDTEPALRAALRQAMSLPAQELRQMGEAGREWIKREFGWQRSGSMMAEAYTWLLDRRPARPEWVRLD